MRQGFQRRGRVGVRAAALWPLADPDAVVAVWAGEGDAGTLDAWSLAATRAAEAGWLDSPADFFLAMVRWSSSHMTRPLLWRLYRMLALGGPNLPALVGETAESPTHPRV